MNRQIVFWGLLLAIDVIVIGGMLHLFWPAEPPKVGIYQDHDRYGYTLKPNSTGTITLEDREITYTIDHNGQRTAPRRWVADGTVLFVGGSFTFGHAVNDDETFPYILADKYWPTWRISNQAVNAWSTTHVYLKILEELRSAAPPSVIIYGFIGHHIMRNSRRSDWLEGLDRSLPHFEVENGELRFLGMIDANHTFEPLSETELHNKELEITVALIREINQVCNDAGVPFMMILLPEKAGAYRPKILLDTIASENIPVLELAHIKIEAFDTDVHPNPSDNALIAQAIAESFITDRLFEIARD